MFKNDTRLECEKDTYFFDKEFVEILQKLIKEKEEKIEDFEVASDGRIIKVNNKQNEKEIFVVYDGAYNYDCEYYKENATKIVDMAQHYLDFILLYGLAYETKEARDRALFKIGIETKLKNIAERLNNGRKIDWENLKQEKYYLEYDFDCERFSTYAVNDHRVQGVIYCLDYRFLEVAKKEIGEKNLIKYFKE